MVKTFQAYLPNKCHRTYSCVHCRAHLANHDELISKVRKCFFIESLPLRDTRMLSSDRARARACVCVCVCCHVAGVCFLVCVFVCVFLAVAVSASAPFSSLARVSVCLSACL
jgi:hypothetical protein